MKQFLFLSVLMLLGAFGSLYSPFWGLLLYYTLAVLRPQYLWDWALPMEIRWSLIAAGLAMLGVVINLPRLVLHGRMNAVAWLILGHAVFLLLSVLTAYDPELAQTWGFEYLKIILMAAVATFVIDEIWQIKTIAAMMLLAIGYVAWEINYLYLIDGRLDIFHRGYGGLDNNGAGLMLAMGLPLAYVFGTMSSTRWRRGASWLLGLFIAHAILMSYSRGAMLSAIVGLAWLLIHHRPRIQAGAIALAICLAVSLLAGREIKDRFLTTTYYQTDGSATSRFSSWSAAWQIASDHPVTGQGIRNSNRFSFNYGADKAGRTIHSQYLQIAADSGIPAMVLYAATLVTAIIFLGRARHTCRTVLQGRLDCKEWEPIDRDMDEALRIAMGFQASLLIFAFGAIFLSLEVFELPWILMTIGGLLPGCVARRLEIFDQAATEVAARGPVESEPTDDPKSLPDEGVMEFPRPSFLGGVVQP